MLVEECAEVIKAYMSENIEGIIMAATDKPISFRYWAQNKRRNSDLGYRLDFNSYTGFGEKPTHHEATGTVLVHWWDNATRRLYLEFLPHPVSCHPVNNPTYRFREVGKYGAFEYESPVGPILVQWDPFIDTETPVAYRLGSVDVDNPTGIVERE